MPLLLVLAVAAPWCWAIVEAPWSIEGFGPTLTGTWEGPLRAQLGGQYHLFLDLRYDDPTRSGPGRSRRRSSDSTPGEADLEGTGRLCAADGATYDYAIRGSADRSGERVQVQLGAPSGVAHAPWFHLRGAWRGETLAVTPTRNPFDPDGAYRPERPTSSDDPEDPLGPTELRKASAADFEAACRRLAGR